MPLQDLETKMNTDRNLVSYPCFYLKSAEFRSKLSVCRRILYGSGWIAGG